MPIRFDRFTIKAAEAFADAQSIALERNQQQLEEDIDKLPRVEGADAGRGRARTVRFLPSLFIGIQANFKI